MRNALFTILFLFLLPILPLVAQDSQPVKPSSEIEPGKEAPGWEARFKKEQGKEQAEGKKERRKEMKKEKKKEHREEGREQKKDERRERRREHEGHR